VRILHVNQYGSRKGGVEAYIADAATALERAGHPSRLVFLEPNDPGDLIAETRRADVSSWPGQPTVAAQTIEGIIADWQPDVAYIHAVYQPELVARIANRLPAVAYVHGPYLVCPGYALYLRRSGRVCGRTAGAGCLVNAQIERCCFGRNPIRHARRLRQVRRLLQATSQIDVLVGSRFIRDRLIANGLDADKVSLLPPVLSTESTREYAPPSRPGVILFAGRITPEKGLRHLMHALASVQADWRLIVAGDGRDRRGCEELTRRLEVAERVEFAGWVTPERMETLYQRCAFVAMPSLWPEPYGRVGPEAFLHGRPAVAYAVGGIPDWLDDGETGYLATPGDIESLRTAITRLLGSPAERERMGRAAHDRAIVRWSADAHVERLLASFETAIGGFRTVASQE